MKWHVWWNAQGERMLQKALNAASDAEEVVLAAERIEQMLEEDPLEAGESRNEDDRIVFHESFAAIFRVDVNDQLVVVHTFWRWAK